MTISSSKIESIAVDAVRNAFSPIPYIQDRLATNDRTPSTDGHFEVYSSEDMSKSQLRGVIDVQVKGRTQRPDSIDHLKYQIDLADLRNFENVHGGVILFVVSVDAKKCRPRAVFFKQLLPYDIEMILKGLRKENQKTIKVTLQPLPQDRCSLERIVDEFIRDKQFQRSTILLEGACAPDELERHGVVVGSYSITKTLFEGEGLLSTETFENGGYIYAVDKNTGLQYAVNRFEGVEKVRRVERRTVSAGGEFLETNVGIGRDGDAIILEFAGFTAYLDPACPHFEFTEQGSFRERLASWKLLRGILFEEAIYVDGFNLARGLGTGNADTTVIDDKIARYERIVRLEEFMHIKGDFDPSELTDSDHRAIEFLAVHVMEGAPYETDGDVSTVMDVRIGSGILKVVCRRTNEHEYKVSDLLGGEFSFSFGLATDEDIAEGRVSKVPTLIGLTKDEYMHVMNIDSEFFAMEMERTPITEGSADTVNNKLLDMILAWDAGAFCTDELIRCCDMLAKSLDNLRGDEITSINALQVKRRQQELCTEDRERLMGILAGSDDFRVKAACHLLLGFQDDAEECLSRLGESDLREFVQWPICRFRENTL